MSRPFAVFGVAILPCGGVAATTRAADRGEAGRIGLPGGKVDQGETPIDALLREAAEEGWLFTNVELNPVHEDYVDGRLVQWFAVESATMLIEYKERGRIAPVVVSKDAVKASGWGNEKLKL